MVDVIRIAAPNLTAVLRKGDGGVSDWIYDRVAYIGWPLSPQGGFWKRVKLGIFGFDIYVEMLWQKQALYFRFPCNCVAKLLFYRRLKNFRGIDENFKILAGGAVSKSGLRCVKF